MGETHMKRKSLAVGAVAVAVGPFIAMAGAQAASAPHTVYVSAGHGAAGGKHGPVFSSVNAAIAAVATGGTVVVEKGTYREDVAVGKAVRIEGQRGATIDASQLINGIKITAPHVTVTGLTVENAVGEGILLQNTSSVTVLGNTVHSNDTGVRLTNPVANTESPIPLMICGRKYATP